MNPLIVGVGGLTSNVGKTTLMCELLRAFPSWEAIKTTRGHYRSCGKDAATCCVSHLLADQPLVRSGREATYEQGKDTARYWDAGATNVHWLIATEQQIDSGIHQAIARVQAEGVFIEGNSFSQFVSPDYFIMVKRAGSAAIKKSAKTILPKVSVLFMFEDSGTTSNNQSSDGVDAFSQFPLSPGLPVLISELRSLAARRSAHR